MVKSDSNTMNVVSDVMAVSGKLGIGAVLVALGVGGLAYTMPMVANSVALDPSDPSIFNKTAKPVLPSEMVPYVGVEAVSAASLAVGIALSSLGLQDTYKPRQQSSKTAPEKAAGSFGEAEAA